jgi:hypothetical protein
MKKGTDRGMRRWRAIALVAAGLTIGVTMMATSAGAHVGGTVSHLWGHLKPITDARYANAVSGTDKAKDADKLDGKDSSDFGVAYLSNATLTDFCAFTTAPEFCTWVDITVPAGKTLRVKVDATGTAYSSDADRISVRLGYRAFGTTNAPTYFSQWTPVTLPAAVQTSFANSGTTTLGPGTWSVGVVTLTNGALDIAPGDTGWTQFVATVSNAAAPAPVTARVPSMRSR